MTEPTATPTTTTQAPTEHRVWATFDGRNYLPVSKPFKSAQAARTWAVAGLNSTDFYVQSEEVD